MIVACCSACGQRNLTRTLALRGARLWPATPVCSRRRRRQECRRCGPEARSTLPGRACQCDGEQCYHDAVKVGLRLQKGEVLLGIERQAQNGGSAARNDTAVAFEARRVEQSRISGTQIDTRWQRCFVDEEVIVDQVVLLDRPPGFGASQ